MIKRGRLTLLALLLGTVGSSGCSVGTGVGAGTGVSYTLDSIAYKTFTAPEEGLRAATLKTLKRMDMEVKENRPTDSGRKIVARAGDREIEIELDRLTAKTSRIRVNAKQGMFFKDRATATEIIIQTERALEDGPVPPRQANPPAATPAAKK